MSFAVRDVAVQNVNIEPIELKRFDNTTPFTSVFEMSENIAKNNFSSSWSLLSELRKHFTDYGALIRDFANQR